MMTKTMSSTATATHPTAGVLARIAVIGARLGRFPLAILPIREAALVDRALPAAAPKTP